MTENCRCCWNPACVSWSMSSIASPSLQCNVLVQFSTTPHLWAPAIASSEHPTYGQSGVVSPDYVANNFKLWGTLKNLQTLLNKGDTKYAEKSIRYCWHALLNIKCEQTAAGVKGCDTGLETLERAKGRPVRRREKCNMMMKCKYFCDCV